MKKPVFGVSDKAYTNRAQCTTTEDDQRLMKYTGIVLSKALINAHLNCTSYCFRIRQKQVFS